MVELEVERILMIRLTHRAGILEDHLALEAIEVVLAHDADQRLEQRGHPGEGGEAWPAMEREHLRDVIFRHARIGIQLLFEMNHRAVNIMEFSGRTLDGNYPPHQLDRLGQHRIAGRGLDQPLEDEKSVALPSRFVLFAKHPDAGGHSLTPSSRRRV